MLEQSDVLCSQDEVVTSTGRRSRVELHLNTYLDVCIVSTLPAKRSSPVLAAVA